ncbi:redoxin domain-containing protein [Candidatus Micrarchaeota archaeon]|nr:redoxin domain-containing protein [Candidatus Micrarchaeota archaeon]
MLGVKVEAPEFKGIEAWINSKPLKMKKLRGKVVLVDFWTYTCVNCRRSISFVKKWHKKYKKDSLVVIGVHSPEFDFEKKPKNVRKAVRELGIDYPVAVDSNMETWDAFDNMFWPAKYVIDKNGYIVEVDFGEGLYKKTETKLQELLGVSKKPEKEPFLAYQPFQSPETYAGFARNQGLGSGLVCDDKGCEFYVDTEETHHPNIIYPDGRWEQEKNYLKLEKPPGKLSYRFTAREANLVVEPLEKKAMADIFIDLKKKKSITVNKPGLYRLFKSREYEEHELGIVFHGKVKAYVFTFG